MQLVHSAVWITTSAIYINLLGAKLKPVVKAIVTLSDHSIKSRATLAWRFALSYLKVFSAELILVLFLARVPVL